MSRTSASSEETVTPPEDAKPTAEVKTKADTDAAMNPRFIFEPPEKN
jgi:hypothetical protein